MEAEDKITRAKVHLQKENPFFAYLVMNLKIKQGDKITKTICVDAKGNLEYNKKWVDKLDFEELKGVLIHEVLHIALEHFLRDTKKEQELYNIASDLVINDILVNNSFKLPDGLVPYNNEFKFTEKFTIEDLDKKSADEVYYELVKSGIFKQKKTLIIFSNKRFDGHLKTDKDGKEKEEQDKEKRKWNRILTEATIYARQQGKLPKGIERVVDLVLNEKVNWKALLYKYITRELPFDYTYNYPSKKSQAIGIYMPSVLRENLEIAVSVDTSGSISQNELSDFLSEIINIAKSFNNINMKLIICDAKIQNVYEVKNGNLETIKNLKIEGGGGTSHEPVYEYVKEKLPNTKFIINFTDGYTTFPENTNLRTIWVITKGGIDKGHIPFGEVIQLE